MIQFRLSQPVLHTQHSSMTSTINDAVASVTNAVKSTLFTKPKEPEDWLGWQEVEQPVDNEEQKMYMIASIICKRLSVLTLRSPGITVTKCVKSSAVFKIATSKSTRTACEQHTSKVSDTSRAPSLSRTTCLRTSDMESSPILARNSPQSLGMRTSRRT